jgi:hypothetical protein
MTKRLRIRQSRTLEDLTDKLAEQRHATLKEAKLKVHTDELHNDFSLLKKRPIRLRLTKTLTESGLLQVKGEEAKRYQEQKLESRSRATADC